MGTHKDVGLAQMIHVQTAQVLTLNNQAFQNNGEANRTQENRTQETNLKRGCVARSCWFAIANREDLQFCWVDSNPKFQKTHSCITDLKKNLQKFLLCPFVGSRCTAWYYTFGGSSRSRSTSKDRSFQDLEHIFIPDPLAPAKVCKSRRWAAGFCISRYP